MFGGSVVSLTKKEYGSEVHFLWILIKSLVLMSDEWFAICWSSPLLGMFATKKWEVFSLTSFGNLKYDWVIKTIEIFNFLPLINNSVTIEFIYLQSYHQKLLIFYFPYQDCNHQYFYKHHTYRLNTQEKL